MIAPPTEAAFTSRLRSAAVAARIGMWLGICFTIAFVTGLISHYAQVPDQPVPFPTSPSWGYRVTQGLHVTTGIASIPLLLVKLWTVYPKLFAPLPKPSKEGLVNGLERASIGVLVAAAIFQLATGVANAAQWYPWDFSFLGSHFAVAWVAIGALVVHIAVKLPIIRTALTSSVEDTSQDRPTATEPGPISRRTLLRATWLATAVVVITTAGSTVPFLRKISVFAVRTGEGPQGVPINRSAQAAGVTTDDIGPGYALEIVGTGRSVSLSHDDLLELEQRTRDLPIACVEGWSATGTWTGVPVRALLDLVDAPKDSDVRVVSMQRRGGYATTTLQGNFADDPSTLLALMLNGEELSFDHGHPARIIAPNRPGVLQTKWVTRLEVLA